MVSCANTTVGLDPPECSDKSPFQSALLLGYCSVQRGLFKREKCPCSLSQAHECSYLTENEFMGKVFNSGHSLPREGARGTQSSQEIPGMPCVREVSREER